MPNLYTNALATTYPYLPPDMPFANSNRLAEQLSVQFEPVAPDTPDTNPSTENSTNDPNSKYVTPA